MGPYRRAEALCVRQHRQHGDVCLKREEEIFEAFYRTIKDTPRLASFVRELRMAVYFQSREQSFWYAEVLRLCSNVEHVTIMDNYVDNESMEDLNTALSQKDLVDLNFERHLERRDKPRTTFRTTSEILRLFARFSSSPTTLHTYCGT